MEDSLMRAVRWAAELHEGQWRDGEPAIPYLCHPLDVLSRLRYEGRVSDPDVLVTAVLHDVLEETAATAADVEARFGPRVASLVVELTRDEPDAETATALGEEGLRALRTRLLLEEVGRMGPEARSVKLADRMSNLHEARYVRSKSKLARYAAQTHSILAIVPRETNKWLWDGVKRLADEVA
jgi:GTP diphosphokinase / guanosine-3',5'-bis(diphosphate) 3'-diphosphatase